VGSDLCIRDSPRPPPKKKIPGPASHHIYFAILERALGSHYVVCIELVVLFIYLLILFLFPTEQAFITVQRALHWDFDKAL
jgi:hypothetical protein